MHKIKADNTAIIFIGYQNDYFSPQGVLNSTLAETLQSNQCLAHSIDLIEQVKNTAILLIATPIMFSHDYSEIKDAIGILHSIKEQEAFCEGSFGVESIPEFKTYEQRLITLTGKRGLNAFSNTQLAEHLKAHAIENVVIAGLLTPLCVDSTGRDAYDLGYRVYIIEDCTSADNDFNQNYYINTVFPFYAQTITRSALAAQLNH